MRYAFPVGIMLLEWEGQPAEASSLAGERKEAVRFGIVIWGACFDLATDREGQPTSLACLLPAAVALVAL
jgi:hypothetical protein